MKSIRLNTQKQHEMHTRLHLTDENKSKQHPSSYLAYPGEEDGAVVLHDAITLKIANKVRTQAGRHLCACFYLIHFQLTMCARTPCPSLTPPYTSTPQPTRTRP